MSSIDGIRTEPIAGRESASLDLERIFQRYHKRLMQFLRRRGRTPDDAADIAQDAYARLASVDMDDVRAPGTFLFTTALNIMRDRMRSPSTRHAQASVQLEAVPLACPVPHAEQGLAWKEQLLVLEAALAELNPNCRAVFVLHRYRDMPQREIAERLGISVSMVEKYVKRALRHCRQRLDEANDELPQRRRLMS